MSAMATSRYDIITVGGGLGGAALAKSMAEHGVRVLVVEREKRLKDRIRGELMSPWGVAETKATPAGSKSWRVTFVAASGPPSVRVMV